METQAGLSVYQQDCEVIEPRRKAISRLEAEACHLLEQWRRQFGQDTPVPIDRGWHNLAVAFANIDESSADKRIATAVTHLLEARWALQQTVRGD